MLGLVLTMLDDVGAEAAMQVCKQWKNEVVPAVKTHKAFETNEILKFLIEEMKDMKGAAGALEVFQTLLKDNPILGSVKLKDCKENQLREREMIADHLSSLPPEELAKLEKAFSNKENTEWSKCIELAKIYQEAEALTSWSYTGNRDEKLYDCVKRLVRLGHLEQAEMLQKEIGASLNISNNAYALVAGGYVDKGNNAKVLKMADNARDKNVLLRISERYAAKGDLKGVLEMLKRIKQNRESATRDVSYYAIVNDLLLLDEVDKALEVAKLIDDRYWQDQALIMVAMKIAPENKERAKEIAKTISFGSESSLNRFLQKLDNL